MMHQKKYLGETKQIPLPDSTSKAGMRLETVYTVKIFTGSKNSHPVELAPRNDLVSYPEKFMWGSDTHGCRKLALAILADAIGESVAIRLHGEFSKAFLFELDPNNPFNIQQETILAWVSFMDSETGLPPKEKREQFIDPRAISVKLSCLSCGSHVQVSFDGDDALCGVCNSICSIKTVKPSHRQFTMIGESLFFECFPLAFKKFQQGA